MWHYLHDPKFSHFDTIPKVTDTQSHTQTNDNNIYHASIAACGKNLQHLQQMTKYSVQCPRIYKSIIYVDD